jgi:hypothetical protein
MLPIRPRTNKRVLHVYTVSQLRNKSNDGRHINHKKQCNDTVRTSDLKFATYDFSRERMDVLQAYFPLGGIPNMSQHVGRFHRLFQTETLSDRTGIGAQWFQKRLEFAAFIVIGHTPTMRICWGAATGKGRERL